MLIHHDDRRSSALSLPRTSGSVPNGIATSNVRPTSMPKNSGGVTPTMVYGTRSIGSVWPITFAAPSNFDCQYR
jgi:hypothetical protein